MPSSGQVLCAKQTGCLKFELGPLPINVDHAALLEAVLNARLCTRVGGIPISSWNMVQVILYREIVFFLRALIGDLFSTMFFLGVCFTTVQDKGVQLS